MACLKIQNAGGEWRLVRENEPYGPEWRFTGKIDWKCNQQPGDNLSDIWTPEGLMIGNLIKAVTSAIGIRQCMACKGRQRDYNNKGLELQKRVKRVILRS